jgi:L-ascorbate metabolism protein UlaG (beta-lactamase superfamily)
MEIVSLGHSSFKIIGKEITIVSDPYDSEKVGLSFPRTEADVVTISHDHYDHNKISAVRGDAICFDSPGEYEIKNTEIVGVESYHDKAQGAERGLNTIFLYRIDGIKICHLGDLGSDLSSDQLERIDGVDILFVPVGGKYTLDGKEAAKLVSEIEPKIVVPMHFKTGKMTDIDSVDSFLKEIGKDPKKTDRIKIQKKDLPENLEVIILEK